MSTTLDKAKRRSVLIAALRDKTLWPEKFVWDFFECHACAVGLMSRILNIEHHGDVKPDAFMADALGISVEDANRTFVNASAYGRDHMWCITPQMVADRLEAIHNDGSK